MTKRSSKEFYAKKSFVKNSDKEKFVYGGYGIAFDGKGDWSFGNETARNAVIFGVDNSSLSHTDNLKKDILILGEGPIFGIKGSFGASEKNIDINFNKAKAEFCLSLHCNADNGYLSVNGKEIYKFKASNKNNSFPYRFCPGTISNEFATLDLGEVSFVVNVYDFSVDYKSTDKSDILNIHKYLMIKMIFKYFG